MSLEPSQNEPPANTEKSKNKQFAPEFLAAQFKPGQSGNPAGRPKRKPVTQIFEELLAEEGDYEAIKGAIRKVFFERSGMAKVLLLREAGERLEGKIKQDVALSGEVTMTLAERMEKARKRSDE